MIDICGFSSHEGGIDSFSVAAAERLPQQKVMVICQSGRRSRDC
jgi:hypothetical protein